MTTRQARQLFLKVKQACDGMTEAWIEKESDDFKYWLSGLREDVELLHERFGEIENKGFWE